MDTQAFNLLFDEEMVDRLAPIGFRRRGAAGKTLDLVDGINVVSFLRLGGRFGQGYSAAWTLCFRHSFLRTVGALKVPNGVRGTCTEDYPYQFTPLKLIDGSRQLRYDSVRNWDIERYEYANLTEAEVRTHLRMIAGYISDRFTPWARGVTPEIARAQIFPFRIRREDVRIWVEDYDNYFSSR